MLIGECEITADRDELALEMPYHASLLAKISAIALFGLINVAIGLSFVGQFIQEPFPPLLKAFPFFIVYVVFVLRSWSDFIFSFWGQEEVIIASGDIHIRHGAFGYWFSKRRYDAKNIKGLFISKTFDDLPVGAEDSSRDYHRGRIGFNIGKSLFGSWITIRFGSCLDRQQAREVLHLIFERFPQYRPEKAR